MFISPIWSFTGLSDQLVKAAFFSDKVVQFHSASNRSMVDIISAVGQLHRIRSELLNALLCREVGQINKPSPKQWFSLCVLSTRCVRVIPTRWLIYLQHLQRRRSLSLLTQELIPHHISSFDLIRHKAVLALSHSSQALIPRRRETWVTVRIAQHSGPVISPVWRVSIRLLDLR